MPEIRANVKAQVIPLDLKPQREWGTNFKQSSGFIVHFPQRHWMAFFVDQRIVKGDLLSKMKFVNKYKPIAHSVTELGKGWTVYGEPTGEDTIGLTVYTASGKAISAGKARVKEGGVFTFKLQTLYSGITNRGKIDYKISGTGKSDGSWEITGSVTYSK